MLDAVQLAQLRATTESFLTDTCMIEEGTGPLDDYGGNVPNWQLVAAAVACRVIRIGGRQNPSNVQEYGAQEAMIDQYRLIVPHGTLVSVDQRVTVTSTGLTYFITGVMDKWTDKADAQAMMIRERDSDG